VIISAKADVLTLYGEIKQENGKKEATYSIREHRYGSFERSIMLPTDVQTDKARADFGERCSDHQPTQGESVQAEDDQPSKPNKGSSSTGSLTGTGILFTDKARFIPTYFDGNGV